LKPTPSNSKPVALLGIDPGLIRTGYGVIECAGRSTRVVDAGVIRLDNKQSIAHRLVELERELIGIFQEHAVDACAVEQLYAHYAHPRTAILMGHARGVILLVSQRHNVRLVELSANRVKQSLTGHGHATKTQMQHGVKAVFGLTKLPEPPDVADALAIALCAWRAMKVG
jgi:crossover junction endodeoxyribonuclease RuvC